MTVRKAVVSLVAVVVVASVLVPATAFSAGAQQQQASGLVVESLDAPGAATPNSTVTVNATLANPTNGAVTDEVAFRLSGQDRDVVVTRRVTVQPGATTTVSFTLELTNYGTGDYIHGVTTANSSQFAELDVTTESEVSFDEQETDGTQVTVEQVFVPEGGYVTIHDQRLLEGDAIGSVVGVSGYLEPGFHENVTVTLFDVPGAQSNQSSLEQSQILIAMPHQETTNDTTYDFVSSNGTADGPYVADDEVVTDPAPVTVTGASANGTDGTTGTPSEGNETTTAATNGDGTTETPADGNETTGTETASTEGAPVLG